MAANSIRVFLVRYGNLGRIGWFGTVHAIIINRGGEVIVHAVDGIWLGTVLRSHSDPGQQISKGELLRLADANEIRQWSKIKDELPQVLQLAAKHLAAANVAATVLDADLSLDRHVVILQFAGLGGAKLGPMADQLAKVFNVARTQWLRLEDSLPVTFRDPSVQPFQNDVSTGNEGLSDSEVASSDDLELKLLKGLQKIADRSLTGQQLKQFANTHRHQLGLAGLYLQKLRQVKSADHVTRSGRADRKWMVRLKTTAGQMTVGQFRGLIDFAKRFGDGTLRLTTRQGIQFHGVAEGNAIELLASIDQLAMTSRGSCGNSLRNVMCCPLQPITKLQQSARQLAARLARQWMPQAAWLDVNSWANLGPAGEQPYQASWFEWEINSDRLRADDGSNQHIGPTDASVESKLTEDHAYPGGYLAHKWKIAVTTDDHNCVNVRTNDLGIVLRHAVGKYPSDSFKHDPEYIVADLWIGGGLAYKPDKVGSFARLATPLGTVPLHQVETIAGALMDLHQTHYRSPSPQSTKSNQLPPRHFRRLKYLVNDWGVEKIASNLWEKTGIKLMPSQVGSSTEHIVERGVTSNAPHPSCEQGADGNWQCIVGVRAGRMVFDNVSTGAWRQVLSLCRSVAVGAGHTLVFGGLSASGRDEFFSVVSQLLKSQLCFDPLPTVAAKHHVDGQRKTKVASIQTLDHSNNTETLGSLRVITCVGLPTCPWAVEEAERKQQEWNAAAIDAQEQLSHLVQAAQWLFRDNSGLPEGFEATRCPWKDAEFRSTLRVAVSGCPNNCSSPLVADVGIVAEATGLHRVYVGGDANRLGVPVAYLVGPGQLRSMADQLCQEVESLPSDRAAFKRWFAQKSVSRNFAWPQSKN